MFVFVFVSIVQWISSTTKSLLPLAPLCVPHFVTLRVVWNYRLYHLPHKVRMEIYVMIRFLGVLVDVTGVRGDCFLLCLRRRLFSVVLTTMWLTLFVGLVFFFSSSFFFFPHFFVSFSQFSLFVDCDFAFEWKRNVWLDCEIIFFRSSISSLLVNACFDVVVLEQTRRRVRTLESELMRMKSRVESFEERQTPILVRLFRRLGVLSNAALASYLFAWRLVSFIKNEHRLFEFARFLVRRRWKMSLSESSFVRIVWKTVLHVSFPGCLFALSAYLLTRSSSIERNTGILCSLLSSGAMISFWSLFPKSNTLNIGISVSYVLFRIIFNLLPGIFEISGL